MVAISQHLACSPAAVDRSSDVNERAMKRSLMRCLLSMTYSEQRGLFCCPLSCQAVAKVKCFNFINICCCCCTVLSAVIVVVTAMCMNVCMSDYMQAHINIYTHV